MGGVKMGPNSDQNKGPMLPQNWLNISSKPRNGLSMPLRTDPAQTGALRAHQISLQVAQFKGQTFGSCKPQPRGRCSVSRIRISVVLWCVQRPKKNVSDEFDQHVTSMYISI